LRKDRERDGLIETGEAVKRSRKKRQEVQKSARATVPAQQKMAREMEL
jgi:hypothetical protein